MKHTEENRCVWIRLLAVCALLLSFAVSAGEVTYYHNDLAGSPVVATNAQGQVIWRESYRPYGERLTKSPAANTNDIWFTSRREDSTGLIYMGARYYDPILARFISSDPIGFQESNIHSFNRYAYANNNPYSFADRDGRQAVPIVPPRLVTSSAATTIGVLGRPTEQQQLLELEKFSRVPGFSQVDLQFALGGIPGLIAGALSNIVFNSNPFEGPVDNPVIVVDPKGNAIPVGKGESIGESPDGRWKDVKGPDGKSTGVRIDGGHKSHTGTSGEGPHAHRPGVTNPDGTPWLPLKQ